MSWPRCVGLDEAVSEATVVLEGTIAYHYNDVIPGVRPRIIGTHWLFERRPKIVRGNSIGKGIIDAFCDVGFWTLPGDLRISNGRQIQVALVLHTNSEGYITWMPYPCSVDAVLDFSTRESLLVAYGQPVKDLPLTFLFELYLDPDEENEINQWSRFCFTAWEILKVATGKIRIAGPATLPPFPATHYFPAFVPSIPPVSPGAPQPLARTFFPSDRAPQLGDSLSQWFNQSVLWSPTPPAGNTTHYDFISIAAHECGHALGLDHEASSSCLMFPTFALGPERRTLCSSEANKLQSMYGT